MAFLDNQGVSKLCALLKDKFDSLWAAVNGKQGALTAGSNITISGNIISATDTTYTAGDNINIENGEISITGIELNTLGGNNEQEYSELQSTGLYVQSELTGTIDPETGDSEGYTFDSSSIDPFGVYFQHIDDENNYELSFDAEGITFTDINSNSGTLSMNSSGNLEWNGTELGSGGASYTAGNSGIYIDSNYIYNNYLPQHGIPIGLFYNSTKEYTNRGLTPSIDYLSTPPSTISFLEGKLLLCSNINSNQTYNVADLFPDGHTLFCQIVQVKPSGIDWANATTFNSFVGTTVTLSFYYKNYIKVGNVIFYWLDKSGWSSNANAVYNDDAVQIIREALFPEIFSSSGSSLPSAPSNDGTYLLKCVVSSGTPTYSWESVTVGGSY